MEGESTQFFLLLGNGVALAVLSWIGMSVRGVYRELRTLNSRTVTLEEWKRSHEREVDVRQKSLDTRLTELHNDILTLKK